MRDTYRGYEVDYGADHEGYVVYFAKKIVHTSDSYDGALNWIDSERRKARLATNERGPHVK